MDVFEERTPQQETDYLSTLVGEQGKYKSEAELAKGYANLNEFAENLKREAAELREELGKRLSVEDQIKALATRTTEQPSAIEQPATPQPKVESAPAFTEEDLVARIRQVQQQDDAERRARENAQAVTNRLVESLGSTEKANEFVNNKARELGVSVDFLLDAAKRSPTAFYKTVDLESAPAPSPAPRSDINTAALDNRPGQVKPGTYAYYDQMRKDNPKLYWQPKTQNQMHKDARTNERFYG